MYVLVQHTISSPADFWGPSDSVRMPFGVTLHHTFPNKDGTRAVCIWEGDSLESVRRFVESSVGRVSRNEYFEVPNREGISVPTLVAQGAHA